MNARPVPEFPPWRDEMMDAFERQFTDHHDGKKSLEDTRGLDRALQCLMDSYRAIFGLW